MKRKIKNYEKETINNEIWNWFVSERAKNIPVLGPMIQEKAREIAMQQGNVTFKASNGWLSSFRNRYKISWNQMNSNSSEVNSINVQKWKSKISEFVKDYDPMDIYNCDETGLFFRAVPNETLKLKKEKCKNGKLSNERLTVLLCVNMIGDFEKPIVIGKSAKPRCFNNLDMSKLPVIWNANKKTWMTSRIMENWLLQFNNRLLGENRKIILFLDNASCHPKLTLSNIRLAWFPPNTTSITQPMDQGIISCVKLFYRNFLLQSLIANPSHTNDNLDIFKNITPLEAIQWLGGAIELVKPEIIRACFIKTGFIEKEIITNAMDIREEMDKHIEAVHKMCLTVGENNFNEYLTIDSELFTGGEKVLAQNDDNNGSESNTSEDEGGNMINEDVVTYTYQEALIDIKKLQQFAIDQKDDNLLQLVCSTRYHTEAKIAETAI